LLYIFNSFIVSVDFGPCVHLHIMGFSLQINNHNHNSIIQPTL